MRHIGGAIDHARALGQRRVEGDSIGRFIDRDALPGQGRLIGAQAVRLEHPGVGRRLLPWRQHQDIARDNLGRVHLAPRAITQDYRFENQQLVQGRQRLLGT